MADLDHLNDDVPDPDAAPPASAPRVVTARGVMLVGARAVAGLVGIAATAATVVAAAVLPLPSYQAEPLAVSVNPVPAAQQRACAGLALRLGDDAGGSATVASAVGSVEVNHSALHGTVDASRIAQTGEPTGRSATVLTLAPDGGGTDGVPLLAGSQVQQVDGGGLGGLTASECVEARTDTWLVGGSTDTGRTTLLTLANPGEVAATVSITIYSPDGAVEAPGTDGIIVQPNSETSFSLAGFAPGLVSPVVHVASTGGTVVANLQQSTVRILEAGGVDVVGPAAAPSTEVVIPGLVIAGRELVEERVGAPGFQDIIPVLRMFVPGDQPASASITVTPDDGGEPIGVEFDLLPGRVSEFPFEQFEDGSYTVKISSDVPLVAGARASTVGSTGTSDFAWLESADIMRGQALVTAGSAAAATLHLANPTDTTALVTMSGEGSSTGETTVSVPAGGSATVPLENAAYRLGGFDALQIAVSYTGDGVISGFTLSPAGPAAEPIVVYP